MFEELLVSLQPAVYFVSHRAVVASTNDRSPDRSPTTQMNRGALTAGGLFLRWDLKLLFSLSPLWWEITLELVRLLLFNSLFPVQIIPLFPQGQYEQSEKTCNNDIFSLQPCCVHCKSQNKQQLRSSVVMFSYHHWVSLLNHCRVIYLFIYLGNLEKKKSVIWRELHIITIYDVEKNSARCCWWKWSSGLSLWRMGPSIIAQWFFVHFDP